MGLSISRIHIIIILLLMAKFKGGGEVSRVGGSPSLYNTDKNDSYMCTYLHIYMYMYVKESVLKAKRYVTRAGRACSAWHTLPLPDSDLIKAAVRGTVRFSPSMILSWRIWNPP